MTNELDTDSTPVRFVLLAIMFASLWMAVAIPEAFGVALLFAGAYVAIQVGRHTFLTSRGGGCGHDRAPTCEPNPCLVRGGRRVLDRGRARRTGEAVALDGGAAIDYSAPLFLYWVPGRRRLEHIDVETSHFAERFQLFIIIALGEAIVVTGATTAALDVDAGRIAALALAFLSSAALWWLYFDPWPRWPSSNSSSRPGTAPVSRGTVTHIFMS